MIPNQHIKDLLETMGPAEIVNRQRVADYIITNPSKLESLLEVVFEIDYKNHHKAVWTLEFVLNKHLEWILPHLDYYTNNIHLLKHQSALRPMAKINKWIANTYAKNKDNTFRDRLTNKQIELIIETGFDLMIGNNKVATKVYTMDTLYLFGSLPKKDFEWIHLELKNIILQHINSGSPAYKSAGNRILKKLN
jgi:hypothetical protein